MLQQILTAGDTLNFPVTVPGYPASDGWVLKFRLVPRLASASAIVLVASASGDDYQVQVPAATTAAYTPGEYGWTSWVEKGAERYTVQTGGQITILPDPRVAAPGLDTRSTARKALDDARAALANWTPTTRRYRIGDREREFNSTAEIIKLIAFWQGQVDEEERLAGRAEKLGRRIYTRI